MAESISVKPLTTTIGAELSGLNLRSLTDQQVRQVSDALDRHSVLVFRDQHLDLEAQSRFAEIFGPLEPLQSAKFIGKDHVVVLENLISSRNDRPNIGRWAEFPGWHTDSSFTEKVPRAAVLRAEVIPPVGGMTSFATMCGAFDALSSTLRDWLVTLRSIHSYPDGYREGIGVANMAQELQDRFDQEFEPRAQPMVFRHPRSGRLGLFVNPSYTTHVEGLSLAESRALLSFLFTHSTASDFVYRHRWEEGDIVVWDELATLHLAPDPAEYAPHPRRVVRVTAGLEAPVAP